MNANNNALAPSVSQLDRLAALLDGVIMHKRDEAVLQRLYGELIEQRRVAA